MRFLIILSSVVVLGATLGCGQGYETREAPSAGAGDPTAIIQEMETSQPRASGASAPPAKAEAADQEKTKQPAAAPAEEKPAEGAEPKN